MSEETSRESLKRAVESPDEQRAKRHREEQSPRESHKRDRVEGEEMEDEDEDEESLKRQRVECNESSEHEQQQLEPQPEPQIQQGQPEVEPQSEDTQQPEPTPLSEPQSQEIEQPQTYSQLQSQPQSQTTQPQAQTNTPEAEEESKSGIEATSLFHKCTQHEYEVKLMEDSGKISFQTYTNDEEDDSVEALTHLKNIFSKQLPKMPKDYIVRLVFDKRHKTLAMKRDGRIIGGICYRPYKSQRFSEIVFCAVSAKYQIKGFGTRMMNRLKACMQEDDIEFFLTYADNYAIGYFERQGFTKTISMPKERWTGYIKDYDGGTLMEGFIHPSVDYLDIPGMLLKQRNFIHKLTQARTRSCIVYEGLKIKPESLLSIPGVAEAGWEGIKTKMLSGRGLGELKLQLVEIYNKLLAIDRLNLLSNLKDTEEYRAVTEDAIDMMTIRARLNMEGYYLAKEIFRADVVHLIRHAKLIPRVQQVAIQFERYLHDNKVFADIDTSKSNGNPTPNAAAEEPKPAPVPLPTLPPIPTQTSIPIHNMHQQTHTYNQLKHSSASMDMFHSHTYSHSNPINPNPNTLIPVPNNNRPYTTYLPTSALTAVNMGAYYSHTQTYMQHQPQVPMQQPQDNFPFGLQDTRHS